MEIIETDDYYVVTFFPNAVEVEIDDKPERGYKAIIGEQSGEHVVMKVMYSKAMYDLNKVIELAQNIKECPICQRLDANVANIDRMQIRDPTAGMQVPEVPVRAAQIQSTALSTGNPFHDMMAQLMFDTKLNPTGQVIAAAALEDDVLMSKAMPTTVEGMVDLVANLTDYASGNGTLFRSPREVTDYVKALREGAKQPIDEKSTDKKEIPVFRRASTIIVS
jgi:hypothetical protein